MTEAIFAILLFVLIYKVTASIIAAKEPEHEEKRCETNEAELENPTFVTKMGLDHNCEID